MPSTRTAPAEAPRPITYREHPAYLTRESDGLPRTAIVGRDGCWGSRWFHGPLCFERFTSDREPEIPRDGQARFITWQTISRTDRPRGWWRGFPGMSIGLTGYAAVPQDGPIDRDWTAHARRHLKRWRASGWSVREIPLEDYRDAYSGSSQDVILRTMFGSILNGKLKGHQGLARIYGASAAPGGPVEAGFISIDAPETSESLHLMSFIRPAAEASSAGTGLMAHWFDVARERGTKYLDFGIFWQKGDPRSWKGFSRFKSQFGIRFVRYPTPLVRIVSGR
jgi:hypothetical protein